MNEFIDNLVLDFNYHYGEIIEPIRKFIIHDLKIYIEKIIKTIIENPKVQQFSKENIKLLLLILIILIYILLVKINERREVNHAKSHLTEIDEKINKEIRHELSYIKRYKKNNNQRKP